MHSKYFALADTLALIRLCPCKSFKEHSTFCLNSRLLTAQSYAQLGSYVNAITLPILSLCSAASVAIHVFPLRQKAFLVTNGKR